MQPGGFRSILGGRGSCSVGSVRWPPGVSFSFVVRGIGSVGVGGWGLRINIRRVWWTPRFPPALTAGV